MTPVTCPCTEALCATLLATDKIRVVFAHTIALSEAGTPAVPNAEVLDPAVLEQMPGTAAVFALHFGEGREPYVSHTTDLARRLRRVLAPQGALSRRLNLLPYVRAISWTAVGSRFESDLLLYRASREVYGAASARKRLRLRTPACLRLATSNAFPRLYPTHKLSRTGASSTFGPFASRAAAERYMEAVLDLFQLRRCHEELAPHPEHPGCAYAEMKKCLAPCNLGCSAPRYAEESAAVFDFLRTQGASLLSQLEQERSAASDALDFEQAASIHARYEKVKAVAAEAPEAVRLLPELAATIVQPSAEEGHVALFALREGRLTGPAQFSTLGMRLHNEQSGSSSLFAHPVALAPVPLEPAIGASAAPQETLEDRLAAALQSLGPAAPASAVSTEECEDTLALFARWCYRPHARRIGEVIVAETGSREIPVKPLLRAISRVARSAQTPAQAPRT